MERLELLKAASLGYEKQIERLTDAKAEIDNEIAESPVLQVRPNRPVVTKGIPRHISPEGRKRIIEAQKKRWAQAKKAKKAK